MLKGLATYTTRFTMIRIFFPRIYLRLIDLRGYGVGYASILPNCWRNVHYNNYIDGRY